MPRRPFKSIAIFVFCSLLLHALLALGLLHQPSRPDHRFSQVEIELLATKEIKPATRVEETQQIVEQQDQVNEEVDAKAKHLSAFNQKVAKETRAIDHGKFQNAAAKGARAPTPRSQPRGEIPSLSSLAPQFKPQPVQPEVKGDDGNQAQASATDDYLKDVETGLQTLLSTREFIYYSYYNRIKERIRQHWEPSIRNKVKMIYRQGRTIASSKDHVTQVIITLNQSGELITVEVVTPSGLTQLDDAAVEAFKAAQPFPNPPRGLVDDDGTIKIRWDFVLEASSALDGNEKANFAKGLDNESHHSRGL